MRKSIHQRLRTFSRARISSSRKIPRARAAALARLLQACGSLARERAAAGFTLIETLVAISFLTVAIVAPMTLVSQSLSSAFYARDQVTAYNLAQEGIEALRAIRDGNILENAINNANADLLADIPIGTDFTIDARKSDPAEAIDSCALGSCPSLQTDGTLYGHELAWEDTRFTRVLHAEYAGPGGVNGGQDEIRIAVTVTWQTAAAQTRSFTMYENMYRWVEDGSAAE